MERDKEGIREILKEIDRPVTQEDMDTVFREHLTSKVRKKIDEFLAQNTEAIIIETWRELSEEYSDMQEMVDKAFLRNSKVNLGVRVNQTP